MYGGHEQLESFSTPGEVNLEFEGSLVSQLKLPEVSGCFGPRHFLNNDHLTAFQICAS